MNQKKELKKLKDMGFPISVCKSKPSVRKMSDKSVRKKKTIVRKKKTVVKNKGVFEKIKTNLAKGIEECESDLIVQDEIITKASAVKEALIFGKDRAKRVMNNIYKITE